MCILPRRWKDPNVRFTVWDSFMVAEFGEFVEHWKISPGGGGSFGSRDTLRSEISDFSLT